MLDWLYTAISWVMKQWHALFSTFLDPAGGITWALSIMFLVVTVRLILFPLFVKQVKSQRAMQELQPEIAKLRKQYGSDRQGMSQAMMALQKERGVNPLAGCLPILPQIPVFLSLFHVLRRLAPGADGLYSWDDTLTDQAARAKLFGAPISASFNMVGAKQDAILEIATYRDIRIVAMVLIVIMCVTTFFTQKQIMKRSGPVEGQAATVQRLLLYGMPLSLFVSGFFFPIGVLLYWFTNNLWTLGQQFFILRKLPPPGSDAAKAKAAVDKPVVDPRTLAPKPGAKPVRPKPGGPTTSVTGTGGPAAPDGTAAANGSAPQADPVDGTPTAGPSGAAPKPGQTPQNRGKRKRR
ncbi:membrane protein insertase YidC [Blastococcus sp. CT_GayMR16]|uniref:membrane protein insertase YidC n=1 Tax=Blastococcus sp. CT_GayMR16 TaxID=2559607 RepID=UPI0010748B45|nr:membrane protein insertase YidC [Blastococcus sp. CT_GayMR16]TFV88023.1 membrane protein insertase YidC [Blastococcus sp. CT_GayMR16]